MRANNDFAEVKRVYYNKQEIKAIYENDELIWRRPGRSARVSFTIAEDQDITFYFTQSMKEAVHIFWDTETFQQRTTYAGYTAIDALQASISHYFEAGEHSIYFCLEKNTHWSPGAIINGVHYGFFGAQDDELIDSITDVSVVANRTIINLNDYAFLGCVGLSSFKWTNLSSIGDFAFQNTSMENLSVSNISGGLFKTNCFRNDLKGGISLTIKGDTFSSTAGLQGNTSLKKLILSGTYTSIPLGAFKDCSALKEVYISNTAPGFTTISSEAFYNCRCLTQISIPNRFTTIGSKAFYGCSSLETIVFPTQLQSIGASAFQNCTSLNFTNFPANLKTIEAQAFAYCTNLSLREVLPNTITTLGSSVYIGCTNLTDIIIRGKISGTQLFKNCTGLKTIWLTSGCSSITPNITSVNDAPFNNCLSSQGKIFTTYTSRPTAWTEYFRFCGEDDAFSVQWSYSIDPTLQE